MLEGLASPALNLDLLHAALDATAYAAFVKESRRKRAGATKLHRKSGEARDQVETLSRSAQALLPPHKCGGSHHPFVQVRKFRCYTEYLALSLSGGML
jgi:hypothetical protein